MMGNLLANPTILSKNKDKFNIIPVMLTLFSHYYDRLFMGNKMLIEITQVINRRK